MIDKAYAIALMLLIAPVAIASDQGQEVLENFDRTPDGLVDEGDQNLIEDLSEEYFDDEKLDYDKDSINSISDKKTDMECITVGDI